MDTEKFLSAYNESRNGCNAKIRHWLVRRFVYSDGVAECADAGCHWLLDIIATEGVDQFVKHRDSLGGIAFVRVEVAEEKATIFLDVDEGEPFWSRAIDYTGMPDGKFIFYLTDEGDHFFMFLSSEY